MPDFEIRQTTEQPTAALRLTRPMAGIGAAMAEAFPKIYQAVASAGLEPAGMPLARYLEMGSEEVTFECAVPVSRPFAGTAEVRPSTVGGGEAAVALHVGPYERLSETWEALTAWVAEQGRVPAGPFWECYLDDPRETDPTQPHTELYVPLA